MKKDHILYFDSGTSNTRAYLLDREFRICDSAKRAVGSKDSAIAGTNRVLIEGMKALYDQVLAANSLTDGGHLCLRHGDLSVWTEGGPPFGAAHDRAGFCGQPVSLP